MSDFATVILTDGALDYNKMMQNLEMELLRKEILQCTKCELAESRNNVIFGEGNADAGIFIIGEAPGRDEDIQGRPFVGRSGQLLDKILAACSLASRSLLETRYMGRS